MDDISPELGLSDVFSQFFGQSLLQLAQLQANQLGFFGKVEHLAQTLDSSDHHQDVLVFHLSEEHFGQIEEAAVLERVVLDELVEDVERQKYQDLFFGAAKYFVYHFEYLFQNRSREVRDFVLVLEDTENDVRSYPALSTGTA